MERETGLEPATSSFPSWTSRVRVPSPAPFFNNLPAPTKTFTPITPLSSQDFSFELFDSFGPLLQIRFGIDVEIDSEAMAELVGYDLGIDSGLPRQAGVRPSHHLKRC